MSNLLAPLSSYSPSSPDGKTVCRALPSGVENFQTTVNLQPVANPAVVTDPKGRVNLKSAMHPEGTLHPRSAMHPLHSRGVVSPVAAANPTGSCNASLPSCAPLLSFLCITVMLVSMLTVMLASMILWPHQAQAAPPKRFEIQTFTLAVADNMLGIDLALTLDDEDGLYNLLKDGAVVELGIDLSIERKREWWSNADIASLRYTSVIRHDPLSREFYLTMPNVDQPLKDRNLTRLLTNSWQKLSLPLIPLSLIELEGRNQTYVISCSASLNHIETPPWLAQNSVFWSAEIIPPVNISLEYVYQ